MPNEQDQKRKNQKKEAKKEEPVDANPEVIEKGKKIKKDVDELLNKIDDVLEENAEEFVKNYIQQSGE